MQVNWYDKGWCCDVFIVKSVCDLIFVYILILLMLNCLKRWGVTCGPSWSPGSEKWKHKSGNKSSLVNMNWGYGCPFIYFPWAHLPSPTVPFCFSNYTPVTITQLPKDQEGIRMGSCHYHFSAFSLYRTNGSCSLSCTKSPENSLKSGRKKKKSPFHTVTEVVHWLSLP